MLHQYPRTKSNSSDLSIALLRQADIRRTRVHGAPEPPFHILLHIAGMWPALSLLVEGGLTDICEASLLGRVLLTNLTPNNLGACDLKCIRPRLSGLLQHLKT
jgi:hypothetical protein